MGPQNRLHHSLELHNQSIYTNHSGFYPINILFKSLHNNFGGNAINIVMPNASYVFSKNYIYPDNSGIRSGSDFLSGQYLSKALNFKLKYVYYY